MSKSARHWCFTGFVEPDEKNEIQQPEWAPDKMRYMIYQGEISPTTGKFHWQGYVQLHKPQRMTGMKKLLGTWHQWHIEPAYGNSQQAADYCRKPESRAEGFDPVELGLFVALSGERTDIAKAVDCFKNGDWKNVDDATYVKYNKGLEKLAMLKGWKQKDETVRNWKTEVHVLTGKAGMGKSRKAHEIAGKDVFSVQAGTYGNWWWTGYCGHENVIIDDFHGNMNINVLLKIMDRYPMTVPMHGGMTQLLAKKIFITSTTPIDEWYPKDKKRLPEITRRITKTYTDDDYTFEEGDEVEEKIVDTGAALDELYQ